MSTEQLFLILQFCFCSDSILFWQPALHGPPLVPPSWCLTGDSDCILSGEQSSNNQLYLVDGWATPLKNRISSIGMISNPIYIYGKIKKMATKPPTSYGESKVFTWGGENLGGVHRSNRTQHHPPWICAGWWTAMTAMTMSNFQSLNFRKTTFFLHDRTCHL